MIHGPGRAGSKRRFRAFRKNEKAIGKAAIAKDEQVRSDRAARWRYIRQYVTWLRPTPAAWPGSSPWRCWASA